MASEGAVERRKVWLLGIDQVTVRGASSIRKVLDSGDVGRITDTDRQIGDLPLWARWYFPVTRFNSPSYGWFMGFRSESESTYRPCRHFLDQKFSKRAFLDKDVQGIADLLTADPPVEDAALAKVFGQAIFRTFFGDKEVPREVVYAPEHHVDGPLEAFVPWKRWHSQRAVSTVNDWTDGGFKDTGTELPASDSVIDCAHTAFTIWLNGAKILRKVAEDPSVDTEPLFASVGAVDEVPRIAIRNGTLGGLLPENDPAVAGKTVVTVKIGDAARATRDAAWAFGVGVPERQCAAKPALLDFVRAVQAELLKRRRTAAPVP